MLGNMRVYMQSLERYGMLMSPAVQVQGHGALRDSSINQARSTDRVLP